jgi:hypothetical protein
MKPLPPDPVIDEIREVRHRISAQFDHDPKRLVAYYMELQEKYKERLLSNPENQDSLEQEERSPSRRP